MDIRGRQLSLAAEDRRSQEAPESNSTSPDDPVKLSWLETGTQPLPVQRLGLFPGAEISTAGQIRARARQKAPYPEPFQRATVCRQDRCPYPKRQALFPPFASADAEEAQWTIEQLQVCLKAKSAG